MMTETIAPSFALGASDALMVPTYALDLPSSYHKKEYLGLLVTYWFVVLWYVGYLLLRNISLVGLLFPFD